jgi:hypothetical protein
LDSWKKEQVEIMVQIGNKVANDYWEYKLPSGFKRLDEQSKDKEYQLFVNSKYIKKNYAPGNYPDPVKEWNQYKKDNKIVVNLEEIAE